MLTTSSILVSVLVSAAYGGRLRKRSATLAVSPSGCAELNSENNGTHYTALIKVGTPAQSFSVVADTGSNSLIIPSCYCVQQGSCNKDDRCFTGTNTSSTFHMAPIATTLHAKGQQELLITFGSGQVGAVKAVDVVDFGGLQANMSDGILLMVEHALRLPGKFEGIIGFGLPSHTPAEVLIATDEAKMIAPPGSTNGIPVPVGSKEEPAGSGKSMWDWLKKLIPGMGDPANARTPQASKSVVKPRSPKSFLEQANVNRFSMCFHNDGSGGLMRMGSSLPHEDSLTNLGKEHWGLDFRGISVGSGATAKHTAICSQANKSEGMLTACGAIPDSGTSAIMGPKKGIMELMDNLCENWERCKNNHTKMVLAANASSEAAAKIYGFDPWGYKPLDKATTFMVLMQDCASWLQEANASLDEVPSIQFHLGGNGSNEKTQTVEIPSSAYLVESEVEEVEKVKANILGLGTIMLPNKTGKMKKQCLASLGPMEYPTKLNGDVWILGVPLFSQYRVTYDLVAKPSGSISFTNLGNGGCGTCDQGHAGEPASKKPKEALLASRSDRSSQLRSLSGPFREPTLDVTRPL